VVHGKGVGLRVEVGHPFPVDQGRDIPVNKAKSAWPGAFCYNEKFNLAYNMARSGYKWHKSPPGFEPAPTQEPTRPDKGAGK
jgi:hypothetical protein